ncbi:hypothetical protein M422DRAFT_251438 [Sphaerobolus stellatus SS14]|uniref:Unplaced genomic scaffold SPHSTscaffold_38, whole genome shotgun sequence n=1 Tax=Sphaerobolus stellatus (strain SS14) TaxID=990650 RepID=A0A0C9W187_SPHS4|nr:hypothetical protein M422DRAFT_251438 [Sphaerobolus stellatus SS14]
MSTQTQTVTCVSSSSQPGFDPRFLTAQDQHTDCQCCTQSRGLIDSQGHLLGPLPPPTRPRRQMAGTTDTLDLPGLPPGGGSNRPPDDGNDSDNSDGGAPPPDPPPDGDDAINFVDDIRCEL